MDIQSIMSDIGYFLSDYKYIVIIVAVVLIVALIIFLMVKYMPSKGRITDLYDKNGNRKDKKNSSKKDR